MADKYVIKQWSARCTLVHTSVHEILFGVHETFRVNEIHLGVHEILRLHNFFCLIIIFI